MKQVDVFKKALDLSAPWQVHEVLLNMEKHRLTVLIEHTENHPFTCPICDRVGCESLGVERKTWQHLNFFQYKTFISAHIPQINCPNCGANPINVPWSRIGKNATWLYEVSMLS